MCLNLDSSSSSLFVLWKNNICNVKLFNIELSSNYCGTDSSGYFCYSFKEQSFSFVLSSWYLSCTGYHMYVSSKTVY